MAHCGFMGDYVPLCVYIRPGRRQLHPAKKDWHDEWEMMSLSWRYNLNCSKQMKQLQESDILGLRSPLMLIISTHYSSCPYIYYNTKICGNQAVLTCWNRQRLRLVQGHTLDNVSALSDPLRYHRANQGGDVIWLSQLDLNTARNVPGYNILSGF